MSEEEFEIIKKHTVTGGEILKDIRSIKNVQYGALYHHEKYDGTGYMSGIAGEAIPIEARIIAIADTYDAMTSNRSYRKKLSDEVVLSELKKGRGTQFDTELIDAFLEMLEDGFTLEG